MVFGGQIPWFGWVGEADAIRKRVDEAAAAGTTEILYVATGPDPLRDAEAFMRAVGSARS